MTYDWTIPYAVCAVACQFAVTALLAWWGVKLILWSRPMTPRRRSQLALVPLVVGAIHALALASELLARPALRLDQSLGELPGFFSFGGMLDESLLPSVFIKSYLNDASGVLPAGARALDQYALALSIVAVALSAFVVLRAVFAFLRHRTQRRQLSGLLRNSERLAPSSLPADAPPAFASGRIPVLLVEGSLALALVDQGQAQFVMGREEFERLNANELNAVLWHEERHLLRRDLVWSRLMATLHTLVGWIPGVAAGLRRWCLEVERDCDQYALSHGVSNESLASALVRLGQSQGKRRAPRYSPSFPGHGSARIRALSSPAASHQRLKLLRWSALALGICLIVFVRISFW